nr:hypothetical protein [Clostridia bacterium]
MKLKASLSLDSDQYEKGLSRSEKLAKGFGKAFKVSAVAIGAAASAVGVLVKKSIDAYGEYEQLAGGIKKLYGEATDDMMEYASKAYETAGMSANQYMQNVTGFSAALLNSVKGDSKEAAKIADMAMKDISDNANTFGKYTAEELAGVYQALAKGQYMTLDNLNLGFGGTKAGMQQLIDKANELAKAQGMAGDLQIDSYADIVQAIHLVQENLNITNTTEKEAAQTIQGSINMTKAAWENLVAGFADPDANIAELTKNVIVSAGKAASNVVPAIMRAASGIGEAFTVILPQALSNIPNLVQNIGVPLIQTGAQMVLSIGQGITEALPELVTVITGLVDNLVASMDGALPTLIAQGLTWLEGFSGSIRDGAGKLVDAGMKLLLGLAQGIANAMPTIVAKVPTIVSNIAGIINDNLPKILAVGVQIIVTLGKGIIQAIPAIVANFPKIIQAIWDVLMAFNWMKLGGQIVKGIAGGVKAIGSTIGSALKRAGSSAMKSLKGINWASAGKSIVSFISKAAQGALGMLRAALTALGRAGLQAFKNIDWKSLGINLVKGIIRGVVGMVGALGNAVANLVKSAFKRGQNAADSHSPSRLFMRGLGIPIGQGVALGVEKSTSLVENAVSDMVNSALPRALTIPSVGVSGPGASTGNRMIGGASEVWNFNLNYDADADATDMLRDLARGVQRYRMAGAI